MFDAQYRLSSTLAYVTTLLPSSSTSSTAPLCDTSHHAPESPSSQRAPNASSSPVILEPEDDEDMVMCYSDHSDQQACQRHPTSSSFTVESDASARSCAPPPPPPVFAVTSAPVGLQNNAKGLLFPSHPSPFPFPIASEPAFHSEPPAPEPPSSPSAMSISQEQLLPPKVSFQDFALCYRQNQHKQAQRKRLERRLRATKVSIAVSARLARVGAAVQRGLVEGLKQDDKINFVSLYHTLHDLQSSCESTTARSALHRRQDPLLEDGMSDLDSVPDLSPDFFLQLSPQSRSDLLDVLHSVRTDPQFLFDQLRSLTSAQLAALVSSATDASDPGYSSSSSPSSPSSGSRSRAYPYASSASSAFSSSSFSKRIPSGPSGQDHALAFERTNPLAVLLFNSYAAPLDTDTPEARLRVDVWSTVCAKLITHGGNRYYPLIGHILSAWALRSDWKAKPQFELYLMDILQTGAFLLEHIEPPPGLDFGAEPIDPLKTDVAEEFFASAVDSLFKLLDDPDAGLPRAIMEFASAILRKLDDTDTRNRFLEYLFVHWFFSKFLYGALTYPEAQGLLLDFHIRNDAREKLLGQVGLQAYSQVFAVLRSMRHFSMPRPTVRQHVANMLYRLNSVASNIKLPSNEPSQSAYHSSPVSPMLSATDILTLLNGLFPRAHSPVYQSSIQSPAQESSFSSSSAHIDRPGPGVQPGFFRSKADHSSTQNVHNNKTLFPTDMDFLSLPDNSLHQTADRIRFELSQLVEPDEHRNLEHPSNEDWAIFSLSADGKRLTSGLFSDSSSDNLPSSSLDDDMQSTAWGIEGNYEALQTAIVKLVDECPIGDNVDDDYQGLVSSVNDLQIGSQSLKQRFDRAMNHCHYESDFIGAHYWWNAGQQLVRTVTSSGPQLDSDSWILGPMHASCVRSLNKAKTVTERCERDFVALDRNMQRLQKTVKDTMATVTKIRNKMWYMTDVKNSMRYEDAKHLALALKTMVYSARLFKNAPADSRSRGGARGFGGSLLQKPELQVMDLIKAASSQGGPNKLSDEQVDLTRKWLSHNNIDNFCRGEERIHRFCYEVKTSINRLVGETMAETPALWASELFQKERAKFEGSAPRSFVGLSHPNKRPFSLASEDSGYNTAPSYAGSNSRAAPSVSKFSSDLPALQSLFSDKRRVSRDSSSVTDTSSIMGGSSGRAPSTTTGDSCSTIWSSPRPPTHYAASASSLYSRPPSMLSETMTQPSRQKERTKTHEKSAFLDELRQTLASLLLTDLGSPVWSCGSETDAWFGNALDQKRIQTQMEKRARIQRFYDEYDERTSRFALRRMPANRRSRSLEPTEMSCQQVPESSTTGDEKPVYPDPQPPFSYGVVFRRLVEVFSRHGNPFVKLKTLRELRELVIASLSTSHGDRFPVKSHKESTTAQRKRAASYSNSRPRSGGSRTEEDGLQTPTSPAAESVVFGSRPSDYAATPTANEIVETLRGLILEVKPKTVFRDLQFISAFVPSEILNKTDSGTAFVQFGLAALSLKDEVCNSMVEIADQIVSYELTRRHPPLGTEFQRHSHSRPGHAIEDAAGMWIITAKEGNPVAQRELAILYLTHPELLPRVTLPLTLPRDTFKAEMMYRRDEDSKSDPQSMCLALHWMQLSANGGDGLARNRLREREEFESIA